MLNNNDMDRIYGVWVFTGISVTTLLVCTAPNPQLPVARLGLLNCGRLGATSSILMAE